MNWKQDDGGRGQSQRPKQKNDCVVRAFAIAMFMPYDAVYDALAELGRKSCRSTPKTVWKRYASDCGGVKTVFPAVKGEPRMSLDRFCRAFPHGQHVVQCAGHLVAVIDGVAHDDGEPRTDACVYAAWKF